MRPAVGTTRLANVWALVACALACAWLGGCLDPGPACGEGFCPSGTVCDEVHLRCVYPEQLEHCAALLDGTSCIVRGDRPGLCRGQVCMPIVCGDGVAEGAEECDGSDHRGLAGCQQLDDSFHEPRPLRCSDTCTFDRVACGPACGDGVVQAGLEACDGPPVGIDCQREGFYGGPLGCTDCQLDVSQCEGTCGDRVRTAGEVCDATDFGARSCTTEGFYGGTLACNPTCDAVDTSGCVGRCGDGVRNGPEICDGADLGGLSCQSYGWHGGALACRDGCVAVDTTACAGHCGDGVVNGSERCDGFDQGGDSCATLGDVGGALGCDAFCERTAERCFSPGWRPERTGLTATATVVWASASDDVWVGAVGGGLAHHDGARWSVIDAGITDDVHAIWGFGRDRVFATTVDGDLHHYDGAAWRLLHADLGAGMPRTVPAVIWASSPSDVWVATSPEGNAVRSLLRHFDGATWTDRSPGGSVDDIHGTGPADVWVVGGEGLLCQFSGPGPCEQHDTTAGDGYWDHVWGTGPGDVWVEGMDESGFTPVLYHREGVKWGEVLDDVMDIDTGWSVRPGETYVVARGEVLHHAGGRWTPVGETANTGVTDGWTTADGAVWNVGGGGLLRADGLGWQDISVGTSWAAFELWASGPRDVWSIGASIVQHYDGARWRRVEEASGGVHALWGSGPGDLWVVGETLNHFDGARWERRPSPVFVSAIHGSAPDDIWAGSSAGILHYDGAQWRSIATDAVPGVRELSGSSGRDIWALGVDHQILHYDGETWTEHGEGVFGRRAILSLARDDVWVLGDGGAIQHFDGRAWTSVPSATEGNLVDAWGRDPHDLWAVTQDRGVIHYDGTRWSPVEVPSSRLGAITTGLDGDVFIGGNAGLVLHLPQPLPVRHGGACDAPLPAHCNTAVRGTTGGAGDGPIACGSVHGGGEVVYRVDVAVTGVLTARATGGVSMVAAGADGRGGCDPARCLGGPAVEGAALRLDVAQGDIVYLAIGAATAAEPFTLDLVCDKRAP